MNFLWFLRMVKWARNPPSMKQVKVVGAVLAIVLVIVGLDMLGLWPDWAHVAGKPKIH